MGGERLAAFFAVARDHIDDTGRQVILADLGDQQHGQRSILGGLQDNAVSGADRRGVFQRGELGRCVPGYDGADRPKAVRGGCSSGWFRRAGRFCLELTRKATEVAERVYDPSGFAARLCADGVPSLARDEARHLLQPGLQGFGDGREAPARAPEAGSAPLAGNAAAAASTAKSTSSACARGTSPIGSRLAGFSTTRVFPERASRHAPPISICRAR